MASSGLVQPLLTLLVSAGRAENYDDLNWGTSWLSGTEASRRALECLLSNWAHPAFAGRGSYYRRSQPRVNHVIEASIEYSTKPLRLCTLPDSLGHDAFHHMTGYPTSQHKITCGVAEGLLAGTVDPQTSASLAFAVPPSASVTEQREALSAAALLAIASGRALSLPPAYRRGVRLGFCRLFDASTLPPGLAIIAPTGCAPGRCDDR